jgi:hypothetical protein
VSFAKLNSEQTASERAAQESRQADEPVDEVLTDRGPLPAPAWRFGITDPQQWIDLCG